MNTTNQGTVRRKKRRAKNNRYYVNLNMRKKSETSKKLTTAGIHLGIIVAVCAVFGALGWYVYRYMTTDPAFAIQTIHVENNVLISENQILDTMGIHTGLNIFAVDVKKATSELLELPAIKDVSIEKRFPSAVSIRVAERFPVFQFHQGCYFFVDEDGVILDTMSRQPDPTIPVVVGLEIPVVKFGTRLEQEQLDLVLQAVNAFNDSAVKSTLDVARITLSQSDTVVFTTGHNQQIVLGDDNFSYRFEKLHIIVNDLLSKRQQFASVDLRFENVPVVMRN